MVKKNQIAIALLAILSVAALGGYFGFKSYVGNKVQDADVEVDEVQVDGITQSTLALTIKFHLTVSSPVDASFRVNNIEIDYAGSYLGKGSFEINEFSTSQSNYTTKMTINIENQTLYYSLIQGFITLPLLNFTLNADIEFLGILSNVPIQHLSKPFILDGLNGIKFNVSDFTLLGMSQKTIDIQTTVAYENPSSVSAVLPGIIVEILYNNESLGEVKLINVSFASGVNTQSFNATLNVGESSIINDFLLNETIEFDVVGKVALGDLNESENALEVFRSNYLITGLDGLPIYINKFDIVNLTSDRVVIEIDTSFNNTSPVSSLFHKLIIDVIHQGQVVGRIEEENILFQPGMNDLTVTAVLNTTGNNLLDDFIQNDTIDLILNGKVQIAQGDNESDLVQIFIRTLTLDGFGGLPVDVKVFKFIEIRDDTFIFDVEVELMNLSPIETTLSDLVIDLYYNDTKISSLSQGSYNLVQGINNFTFTFEINGSSSNLIDAFINREYIEIFANISAIINSTAYVMNQSLIVSALNGLPSTLENVKILNATENELQLSAEIKFDNPSFITTQLSNIFVNITYQGEVIGNASISSYNLTKGENVIIVNMTFGGNKTLIGDFIGQYIQGKTVSFDCNLTATILLSVGGTPQQFTYNFTQEVEGIQQDLIGIKVTIVTLSLSALASGGTPQYTIATEITVYNPVDFAINITGITADLDFDDDDGASYYVPYVNTWNYAAKDDIFLDHIDGTDFDWATTPLELPASGSKSDSYQFTGTDTEIGIRLYDEYYTDNDLYIDLTNGILNLQIGGFSVTVDNLVINDIYVPNT